jgi:CDP-paratose 2-epimerase
MTPKRKNAGRAAKTGKVTLITGGCGFIGTNLADALLSSGRRVLLYDNLSRPGVERNLCWLRDNYGRLLDVEIADTRDAKTLRNAVKHADRVFHFAAQVAVTTSLTDPVSDFETNTHGTLNLLEAIRRQANPPPLVFTSTNKVYGGLADLALTEANLRYDPADSRILAQGVDESRPLDFHSPYGCSKGAADQYILDYTRTFSIPAVVFRMSCIYGPHQFGNEDQGWVAHFLINALNRETITLYGDGKQVRDILFVQDLVRALLLAQHYMPELSGQAFNIGGGPQNTVSLLELMSLIKDLHGRAPKINYGKWRPGDQRYYVSDTQKFHAATQWTPEVNVRAGVERLNDWLLSTRKAPSIIEAASSAKKVRRYAQTFSRTGAAS